MKTFKSQTKRMLSDIFTILFALATPFIAPLLAALAWWLGN